MTAPGAPAARVEQHERDVDAALARIHLRSGMIALARAELEQMAGAGTLDTPALADLAETRWRSGDLAGAADAAQAHIDAGGDEPMALLISAEALDASGHLLDARALAATVVERVGGQLDRLFAGERRSSAWPAADPTPSPLPQGTVAWGGLVGGREVSDPAPRERAGSDPLAGSITELVDAGRAAGRELDAIEAAVTEGRLVGIAERLALVLRADRALAPVILSHADMAVAATTHSDDHVVAALHLVRGDALRSLGQRSEADAAYQQSMRALAARATTEEAT